MRRRFDAYAAGLVDGEGCITAKSTKSQTGMGIRVLIGMATKASAVLARMHAEYGGTLVTHSPSNPEHSRILTWTVTGSEAAAFLRRIEPYLLLKNEQAALALRIEGIRTSLPRLGSRDHHKWTPEAMTRCETIYRRIMRLNERGSTSEISRPINGREIAQLVDGQWLTNQGDLFSDLGWAPFSGTWPRCGMTCGGRAYELPTWGRLTGGNGSSSLLPTPRTSDTNGAGEHGTGGPDLRTVAETLLPTPTSRDWKDGTSAGTVPANALLGRQVWELLPTPTATDAKASGGSTPSDVTLTDAVVRTRLGANTNPRFDDGNGPSDAQLPHPPNPAPEADSDSVPGLWNG